MKTEPLLKTPVLQEIQANELPTLTIELTEATQDFQTKGVRLQAKGWTTAEAKDAMEFLLKKHASITKQR